MNHMLDYCPPPLRDPIIEWCETEPSWSKVGRSQKKRRKALRELEAALASPAVATRPLAERFREHADKWQRETAFLSATPMIVLHDSYQAIMTMGPDVIPLLL